MTEAQEAMAAVLDRHVQAEIDGDLKTTMATMTDDPHLINVPLFIGGKGREGVERFYREDLVGKFFPPDVKMNSVSRTVGEDRIVDELVISFTHTTPLRWMLPGIEPTGRRVEVAFVVVVGFQDGKIAYEHIHWDHAGALAQLGLIDPALVPASGAQSARWLVDPARPALKP